MNRQIEERRRVLTQAPAKVEERSQRGREYGTESLKLRRCVPESEVEKGTAFKGSGSENGSMVKHGQIGELQKEGYAWV